MRVLIFTVVLAVFQAAPPVPRQTADNPAQSSEKAAKQTQSNQPPSPQPSAPVNKVTTDGDKEKSKPITTSNTEQTVEISKFPTVTVSPTKRDWADWAYWCFNLLLAVVGGLQILLLWRTLGAIRRQADLMESSLFAVQRAFIFFRGMDTLRIVDAATNKVLEWHIQAQWENSGTTPSKDLEMHINWEFREKPIPLRFDFPSHGPKVPYVLGPKATVSCGPVKIPIETLLGIQHGTVHAYIWGIATYKDVFKGTSKHATKFCWKLTGVLGDPTSQNATLTWAAHDEHNCADDDCK